MGNNTNTKRYVMHPRYGDRPIESEFKFTKDEIERAFWRYSSVKYFSNTAIPADISKQNYAVFPRKIYVDIEEHCEKCKRPFLFFALEQRHWFETLGFWIDAHCTRCVDCRRSDNEIKKMQRTYNSLIQKEGRTAAETAELKQCALELYMRGYIKDKGKIDNI